MLLMSFSVGGSIHSSISTCIFIVQGSIASHEAPWVNRCFCSLRGVPLKTGLSPSTFCNGRTLDYVSCLQSHVLAAPSFGASLSRHSCILEYSSCQHSLWTFSCVEDYQVSGRRTRIFHQVDDLCTAPDICLYMYPWDQPIDQKVLC